MSDTPDAKRAKIEKDDDLGELTHTVWEHYRNYLDSLEESEGGDIDELQELIEIAKESVDKPSLAAENIDSLEIVCPSWKSRKEMIPVLLSVAYHQLADGAISEYLMMEQQKETSIDTENNESIAKAMETAQNLLIESLEWYPYNASTWSMGANFGRMSQSLSISSSRSWYEMAVRASSIIREHALEALEDESIPDEEKEWIELLVLNQVVGVEYEDDDDENDEEEECNEDEENEDEGGDDQEDTGWYSASAVESTARFICAMLCSMDGRHDRALDHLKSFGLTHRLHPNVWKTGPSDRPKAALCAPSKPPLVFQPEGGIIPPSLYDSMTKLFAPNAAYWKESDYSTRGYYSFFHDFDGANAKPSNLIEEVIISHLLPRAQQCLDNMTDTSDASESSQICGFEWWAHTRPIQANLGHNLHFDTDESMLDQEGKVTHPVLSSVLYLTGGNENVSSGATIILDETPDSTALGETCYLGIPKDNTFLIFPGNRLHGVLPCPGIQHNDDSAEKDKALDIKTLMHDWKTEKKAAASMEDPPHRLTFMVGFWTRNVPATMKHRSLYGPCGPLPPATEEHSWVKDIMQGYNDETTTRHPAANKNMTATALSQVSPAWEIIQANETEGKSEDGDDEKGPQLHIPHGIDHRFFVRGAPDCFRNSLFEDRNTADC